MITPCRDGDDGGNGGWCSAWRLRNGKTSGGGCCCCCCSPSLPPLTPTQTIAIAIALAAVLAIILMFVIVNYCKYPDVYHRQPLPVPFVPANVWWFGLFMSLMPFWELCSIKQRRRKPSDFTIQFSLPSVKVFFFGCFGVRFVSAFCRRRGTTYVRRWGKEVRFYLKTYIYSYDSIPYSFFLLFFFFFKKNLNLSWRSQSQVHTVARVVILFKKSSTSPFKIVNVTVTITVTVARNHNCNRSP